MSDQQQRLLETADEFVGQKYRTTSRGGAVSVQPLVSDDQRKAAAAERLASLGDDIRGKDARSKSLATREAIDAAKLIEEAKTKCANPVKLSWKHIKFEVEVKNNEEEVKASGKEYERRMIVKDCSGYAAPGLATYIMGSSGAGKTSLLNILSDRVALINKATLSGDIMFNDDIPVIQDTFARYAAYVM